MKFLQLPSFSGDAGGMDFPNDLPGVCHITSDLEEGEPVGEFDDVRFPLIQRHTQFFTLLRNLLLAVFQVLLVLVNEIEVIHVATIPFDTQDFLDIVIDVTRHRRGKQLTDLTTQSQTFTLVRRGVRVKLLYQILTQADNPEIGKFFAKEFQHRPVHDVVEKRLEIADQDVTTCTVLSDVPLKMTHQTLHGEIIAFLFHTRSVVVDKSATHHRDESVVTQTALNNSFSYNRAADVPFLPSFINVKFKEGGALVCPVHQLHPCVVHIERCLRDVPLHTGFPRHILAAFLIGSVQVSVSKNLLVIIRISPLHALSFRSCCLAALIP